MSNEINQVKFWRVPYPLAGNIFLFGRVGSGKSCKSLVFAQAYFEKGYKIFDVFGGRRGEGPFWCFPNTDDNLWKDLENETYDLSEAGPKEYKVNLLYPMFKSKMPKKLPNFPPRIKAKVFTIPFRELDADMLSLVLGPVGLTVKSMWSKLLDLTDKKSTGTDIEALFETELRAKQYANSSAYTLFVKPLVENRLLSSQNSSLALDIEAECDEKDTITVLNLEYIPEKYWFLVMGYFIKQQMKLVMANTIPAKNINIYREASYFMKVVDGDKSKEDTASIFRNLVVDSARYARSGLFTLADTQDSSEVKGMIEGSEDLLGICEMPSPTSREVTCAPLKRDRRMNEAQMRYISMMPKHQICVVTRGEKAVILKRIQPPRCKYWKAEEGNFETQWKKLMDSYINSDYFIDVIDEEYKSRTEMAQIMKIEYANKHKKEVNDEDDFDGEGTDPELAESGDSSGDSSHSSDIGTSEESFDTAEAENTEQSGDDNSNATDDGIKRRTRNAGFSSADTAEESSVATADFE